MRKLLFPLLLLTPSLAWAQTDNAARAQSLFDQAVAASRTHDYASACPKFAASQKLDPKTSTLLNLASCYELNGQTASAWATFKEAQAAAVRRGRTEWADRAAAAVKSLEPKLVRLTVHVPPSMRGLSLRVELDGTAMQETEWDQPLPVDPGEHRVGWAAPGYVPQSAAVAVTTANRELTLTELQRAPQPATPVARTTNEAPTRPVSPWTTGRVVGVALGATGVAALAAGSGFGLAASSKYDEAERLCGVSAGDTRTCLPERSTEALAARDDASTRATTSTVLFVAGGVLAASGAALFLLSPPRGGRSMALVPWERGVAAVGLW